MSHPGKLLSTTIAILVCVYAGVVLDTAAAAPTVAARIAAAARTAKVAQRSGARRQRSRRNACRASRRGHRIHGRKAHRACRSRVAHPGASHAARLGGSHAAHDRSTGRALGGRRRHAATPAVFPSPAGPSIASVLATPCQNTELTPEPGNLQAIDAATLCLVNQERARGGESPLQANAQLAQAAQRHSEEMVSADYFAHVAPSGLTPVGRVQATGYIPNSRVGYTIGENIAWGTLQLSTPSAIVAAWIASPEHLANILYAPYRDTAVGVVATVPASLGEGQPGAIYSQEFGVIVD